MIDKLPLDSPVRLLDAGSGTGLGSVSLASRAKEGSAIVAVDYSHTLTEYALSSVPRGLPIEFHAMDINEVPKRFPQPFDGVVAFNSIHLLGETASILQLLSSSVRQGGFVAFCSGYSSRAVESPEERLAIGLAIQEMQARAVSEFAHLIGDDRRFGAERTIFPVRERRLTKHLTEAGLRPSVIAFEPVTLPVDSIVDFLSLPGVGDSVLPDSIPVEDRRRIIRSTVEARGLEGLSRTWCYVVAEKQ